MQVVSVPPPAPGPCLQEACCQRSPTRCAHLPRVLQLGCSPPESHSLEAELRPCTCSPPTRRPQPRLAAPPEDRDALRARLPPQL